MKNPCHKEEIPSLNRIEGQIRGIANMIDDDKYCGNLREVIKFAFLVFLIFLQPYHQNPFRHLMLL